MDAVWAIALAAAAVLFATTSWSLDRRNRARLGVTSMAIRGQERLWLPGPRARVLDAAQDALLALPGAVPNRLRRRDDSVSMRTRWGAASWGQRVTVTAADRPGGVEVLIASTSFIPTTRIDYGVNVANTRDVAAFLTGRVSGP